MKRSIIILSVFSVLFILPSKECDGQIREFGHFIASGQEDAQKLFKAYMTPYANGLGASLSGGWYNTAKAHKPGGFDVSLSISTAIVPKNDRVYNSNNLNLNSIVPLDVADAESPTIAGKKEGGPQMLFDFEGINGNAYTLPAGTGVPYVPVPMITAGIGLFKGTELKGRYLPNLGNNTGKLGFWGVGLKHDIKQWIPGLKKVPVLNIALAGGYTKLNSYVNLDVQPDYIGLTDFFNESIDPATWDDQQMALNVSSFTANLLVSADLPVVCFYGGLGFAKTTTSLKLEGNYPMMELNNAVPTPTIVADPIDIEIKNQDGGLVKPRFNTGIRFKMGIVVMTLDYTRANYNVATLGIGISFR